MERPRRPPSGLPFVALETLPFCMRPRRDTWGGLCRTETNGSRLGTEWRIYHGRQRESDAAKKREKDRRHNVHRDLTLQRTGSYCGGPCPASIGHSYQGAEDP